MMQNKKKNHTKIILTHIYKSVTNTRTNLQIYLFNSPYYAFQQLTHKQPTLMQTPLRGKTTIIHMTHKYTNKCLCKLKIINVYNKIKLFIWHSVNVMLKRIFLKSFTFKIQINELNNRQWRSKDFGSQHKKN